MLDRLTPESISPFSSEKSNRESAARKKTADWLTPTIYQNDPAFMNDDKSRSQFEATSKLKMEQILPFLQ
jgi:hypothetical protein